jgi:hypothetical protein
MDANSPCGRGGFCGANPTPAQKTLMRKEKAARDVDADLLARNRNDIEDLRRRFGQAIDALGVIGLSR